jgi:hypothetical protein
MWSRIEINQDASTFQNEMLSSRLAIEKLYTEGDHRDLQVLYPKLPVPCCGPRFHRAEWEVAQLHLRRPG